MQVTNFSGATHPLRKPAAVTPKFSAAKQQSPGDGFTRQSTTGSSKPSPVLFSADTSEKAQQELYKLRKQSRINRSQLLKQPNPIEQFLLEEDEEIVQKEIQRIKEEKKTPKKEALTDWTKATQPVKQKPKKEVLGIWKSEKIDK
jgi:hypothetical protein